MKQTIDWASDQVIDVLIVGYGPVGAALAALLGRYGVQAQVIDKLNDVLMLPRAIALDNEALRILQMAGLDDQSFERVGIQEVRMRCPYLGEFGRVNTRGTIDGHPKLVTFYQPDLEHALRRQVEAAGSIDVTTGTELLDLQQQQEEGVVATVRNAQGQQQTILARYLVGADGARSVVRGLIGQAFKGETYAQDWLIVDAHHRDKASVDHVEFICDPRRPTPHMPAPGGRERWEFMLQPHENAKDMEQPEQIEKLLAPWARLSELTVERQAGYRFHARCCEAFQKDRVFLVGDAAHVTPPFVGQGLVAGLRDVANLAWKLAWVVQGKANPAILDSYDTERRPHARSMIRLAKLMGKLVMPTSAPRAIAIHGAMRGLRLIAPLRSYFEELKIKPPNQFRAGLFQRAKRRGGVVRGAQLPQEWLRTDQGLRLSDDVLGDHLMLVGLGVDPKTRLTAGSCQRWEAAGGQFLHLGWRGQAPQSDSLFAEIMGNNLMMGDASGWLVVVRPDRVVMLDGEPEAAEKLISQACALLC